MSAQEKQDHNTALAQLELQRIADLSELLEHAHASWDAQRRGLSRQLHDSVGSSLTALTMHLSLLAQQMPQDKVLLDRTAHMKQLLLNIIATNRQMQTDLWNDKLEFLGVNVALGEVAAEFGAQHQMAVRCSLPEDEPVCPREYGVVLLRTLEEGLRNIVSHAQASEVDVIFDDNDEALMLTVKDNGIGPQGQPAGPDSGGPGPRHGLRALRERTRHLGGSLALAANPDGGAALTVILPRVAAT